MQVKTVATHPFAGQKPGTSGMRQKTATFMQPHYLENFIAAIFEAIGGIEGKTLVVGGDGRYFNDRAIQAILKMAAAGNAARMIVGRGGILSTPAASAVIRHRRSDGGIILSASHNPGGPDGDFGVKFNTPAGSPAPESITAAIHARTLDITSYRIAEAGDAELSALGETWLGGTAVEVIDPVAIYADLMRRLFDFDAIRALIASGFTLCFDAMHAVSGPYAKAILGEALGAPAGSVINAVPLDDFGGGHPDPNPVYARPLVELMMGPDAPDFGAATDGDGDRNMILGPGLFLSPGDSLAMLAAQLHHCPGYADGIRGIARSMPTCRAADAVAAALDVPLHETPTGWKFFCNLLDSGQITVCGEESFGTGSVHVREKDGLWAVLAWANILAATGKRLPEIAAEHWQRHGRHYFVRHDYENLAADTADAVMTALEAALPGLIGQRFGDWTVSHADNFAYLDPVDASHARGQGLRIVFGDAARIVLRKSGTGTQGATLRLYLESWRRDRLDLEPAAALAELARLAETLTGIARRTGRSAPDVVT